MCDFRTGLHACAGGGHLTHAGEGCEAFAGAARSIETKAMGFREGNKLIALICFNAGRVLGNFLNLISIPPTLISHGVFTREGLIEQAEQGCAGHFKNAEDAEGINSSIRADMG